MKKLPPHVAARETDRWTEIMLRALSNRVAKRWRFVSFRGKNKREWRGIVDVVAIRKDTSQPASKRLKRGDLLDIILIQMKGGSASSPALTKSIAFRKSPDITAHERWFSSSGTAERLRLSVP